VSVDVTDLRGFYGSSLGIVAQRFVGQAIGGFWRDLRGLSLLGLGYATPYLPMFQEECERVLAFMPACQGVVNWPSTGLSCSGLVDPLMMPLAEASVDRVLVVHGLEIVDSPTDLLSEAWRVLTPGGRLILVVPNRRGLWARLDTTPFGEGRPFSRSQLRDLLRQTQFSPEGWAETLYVPPLRNRVLLRGAVAWERIGIRLSLPFHGLHVVEATKQFHRVLPIYEKRRTHRLAPVFAPVSAASTTFQRQNIAPAGRAVPTGSTIELVGSTDSDLA
jgi:SAM-dependent methyltransferase